MSTTMTTDLSMVKDMVCIEQTAIVLRERENTEVRITKK